MSSRLGKSNVDSYFHSDVVAPAVHASFSNVSH